MIKVVKFDLWQFQSGVNFDPFPSIVQIFEKHPFFQFSLSLFLNMKETLFSDFKDTGAYTLQSEVAPPGIFHDISRYFK